MVENDLDKRQYRWQLNTGAASRVIRHNVSDFGSLKKLVDKHVGASQETRRGIAADAAGWVSRRNLTNNRTELCGVLKRLETEMNQCLDDNTLSNFRRNSLKSLEDAVIGALEAVDTALAGLGDNSRSTGSTHEQALQAIRAV